MRAVRAAARCWKGEGVRIALHFVLLGEFAGLAGFRRRVAADKTSKQLLTDTINRGSCTAAVAEAMGQERGTIWG